MKQHKSKNFFTSIMLIACFFFLNYWNSSVLADNWIIGEVLTAEEEDIIQEQLTYTVGYNGANIPISYMLSGKLTGVSIEMMNDFSEMSAVIFDYVDMDDPKNQDRDVDMNLKMDNFSELSISDPFMTAPTMLVTMEQRDKAVETIGILDSLGLITPFASLEGKNVVEFSKIGDMELALKKGEIDGFVISTLRFPSIATEVDDYLFHIEMLQDELEYNIYFSEGFPEEKIQVFNKLIAAYGDLRMDYLVAKHSNYATATMSTLELVYENFSLIFVSFFIGICLVSSVVVFYQVKQRRKLLHQMAFDELTGLYTERKFAEETKRLLREKKDDTFTLLVFDIDNFKYINEIYSYEVGSQILVELSRIVKEQLAENTPLARSYGDNFLMLLNREQERKLRDSGISNFSNLASQMGHILGKEYTFSFSLGLYQIKDATEDISLMIDSATFARNKGKSTAGVSMHHYDEAMMQERATNNIVSVTMQEALNHQEFVVYYQPKFDLKTVKTIGAEALVRWFRNGKLVPPNDFIPIFEKNGFIEKLDYYVLEAVCCFIRENKHLEHRDENTGHQPRISVNLSGVTILNDNLEEKINGILERTGVKPTQIDLEVTESAFVDGFDSAVGKLERLRSLGFTISMDDFGAGVSSLNRLKGIPLDVLKIDREFIVDSLENAKGRAIIRNIIQMAKDIDLETVAEGLETQEQLNLLRDLGCDVGQGYFYARPLPEEDFKTHLSSKQT